ncbi:MAG TPA: ribosomal protein S18-alanine N-acetyltransferase [Dehalococcoidia bacterium]|nr:ribosomal protein S18-alanine N-acetyltransferase [Dehalococcoidia bacterium]
MAAVASPYLVRPMTIADIPQVTEIERESFPTMWPQTAYKRELQQNSMARYLVVSRPAPGAALTAATPASGGLGGAVRGLRRMLRKEPDVAAAGEQLVGFLGLWFMLEECHVVTVAVREALRRQGIGELLVITAVDLALRRQQAVLTLECRVSNIGAQALYERYGFERVGVRRRYYTDNNEDALIMTTPPIRTPEYREHFARLRAAHAERWGAADLLLPS